LPEAVVETTFKGVLQSLSTDSAVRLTEVRLEQFRNLARVALEVPAEGAVLVGENGQGKTNFLETIYYLSRFRSFRGSRHAEAVAFGAGHFRIEGRFDPADGPTRTLAVSANHERRQIALDGAVVGRPSEALGTLLAVTVRPEDLELVNGAPAGRRAYLDELLSLVSRPYRRALGDYERVLRQRNELLRSGRAAAAQLEAWDEALISAGAAIVVARARLVARLAPRFARIAATIASGDGGYGFEYRSSVPVEPDRADREECVRDAWSRALVDRYEVDRARGWTTIGPHRDDLELRLEDRELSRYGSQGERRTAAVALRLLEAEVLETDIGQRPILLLDDVFSELDEGRAERLLDWLGDRHQRFVTSPRPLSWLPHGLARWTVAAGRIDGPAAAE
jgi:DNA replication and repair protein RecF